LAEKGATREDLLRKLEEVIKNGEASVNGVSSDSSSDKISETSAETNLASLFEDDAVKSDSSSFTLDDSVEKIPGDKVADMGEKSIEELRNEYIQKITTLLQQEPGVNNNELKPENQNWLTQLKNANKLREVSGI